MFIMKIIGNIHEETHFANLLVRRNVKHLHRFLSDRIPVSTTCQARIVKYDTQIELLPWMEAVPVMLKERKITPSRAGPFLRRS